MIKLSDHFPRLIPCLIVDSLLLDWTSGSISGSSICGLALRVVFGEAARVLVAADFGSEAGVIVGVAIEATLLQVFALGFGLSMLPGHTLDVRRGLAAIVLAVVTTSTRLSGLGLKLGL